MKKIVLVLATVIAIAAVSSCKNKKAAQEAAATETECVCDSTKCCCDSAACACCDSTKCEGCCKAE